MSVSRPIHVDDKQLRQHRHMQVNSFSDTETLVQAIAARPGFAGTNPLCHLALLARRKTVHFTDIEEAIATDKLLVRAGAFRAALFVLSARDYPTYFQALKPVLKDAGMAYLHQHNMSHRTLENCANVLEKQSWDGHCLQAQEILRMLYPKASQRPQGDLAGLILRKLCDMGVLLRTSTKGPQSNQFAYGLMNEWFPKIPTSRARSASAQARMIRLYLKCYGPATEQDIAYWTGLDLKIVKQALQKLQRYLVWFRISNQQQLFAGVSDTLRNPDNKPEDCEDIVFLPPWDPYTLGWQDKKFFLDKKWEPWVYSTPTNSAGVIVEWGKVVGVWQLQRGAGGTAAILQYHVFQNDSEWEKSVLQHAHQHAIVLQKAFNLPAVSVQKHPLPVETLTQRPRGSFLWPLGKQTPQQTSLLERRHRNTFRSNYLQKEPTTNST
ncbi:MAG: crosslink repair DNA glycosylase YcaQ family protein [Myxococcota bacterium]